MTIPLWVLRQRGNIQRTLIIAGWNAVILPNKEIDGVKYICIDVKKFRHRPVNQKLVDELFESKEDNFGYAPELSVDKLTDKHMVLYFRERTRDEEVETPAFTNRYGQTAALGRGRR